MRIPTDIKQQILHAVASIEYGSVEIVVHDGRVVQIECREKIRVGRP
ncbi:MAG: YezD family protein, partial [Betaproteobacteria bacterium]|nr:YezD family protein [Betaproteobacteria bacterium]